MSSAETYAAEALAAWAAANSGVLSTYGFQMKLRGPESGKVAVQLTGSAHLVSLCAWDHAACLDIQILEIETGESEFPTTGTCETRADFDAHLSRFLSWAAASNGHAA